MSIMSVHWSSLALLREQSEAAADAEWASTMAFIYNLLALYANLSGETNLFGMAVQAIDLNSPLGSTVS